MVSRIQYNNPKDSGALGLAYHYEMISDEKRIIPFKKAIIATCKGKRILESGTGSGILSILAAKAGAKKVYAVEIDQDVAKFAEENIRKNQYNKIITLINKDIKKISLSDIDNERVDVVIAENLSTWQVTEPQIQIMNHINKFLAKKDGIRLPEKVFNQISLAQSKYRFEDVIELRVHYFEFSGIKKSKLLSNENLFEEIDLYQQNAIEINKKVKIKVNYDGILNSVKLASPIQIYKDIMFDFSDSLMPHVIFPLKNDAKVKKGDIIELILKYKSNTYWEKFDCQLSDINLD